MRTRPAEERNGDVQDSHALLSFRERKRGANICELRTREDQREKRAKGLRRNDKKGKREREKTKVVKRERMGSEQRVMRMRKGAGVRGIEERKGRNGGMIVKD